MKFAQLQDSSSHIEGACSFSPRNSSFPPDQIFVDNFRMLEGKMTHPFLQFILGATEPHFCALFRVFYGFTEQTVYRQLVKICIKLIH